MIVINKNKVYGRLLSIVKKNKIKNKDSIINIYVWLIIIWVCVFEFIGYRV